MSDIIKMKKDDLLPTGERSNFASGTHEASTWSGNMAWWLRPCLSCLLLFSLLFACKKKQAEPEIIVRVGTETLTVADLANEIPSQLRPNLTRSELQDYVVRWIDSQILYQEAKRRQLDQNHEVRRELRRLERELVVNTLLDQELNKPFGVSDQEINRYYAENRQSFVRNAREVHVWYVKVLKKETADSLVTALRKDGDFSRVARRYAPHDSSEWDLYLTEEETPPEIVNMVFTIMPGAISRPIQFYDGFHIFKMIEKFEPGSLRSLAQVRNEIIAKIQTEKRQERYKQLLAELKSNTVIEKNFHLLETLSVDSLVSSAAEKTEARK
ncbi:MAG: peptidyl-prolyl cis-trans isomerase [candidate division KSB1 bacterium]|nr:peptidyl-prolyl cis-trans isomerase [candidate division KSB1 bacterium]MDZ7301951.1 peptidyl-prolyl cis-trans isomerase [candidate division KSB1 bacterium]MDZ7312356.1 peptidyl-prolyl cis-trans isomerase [candidate division KSB1 bacterium]